MSFPNQAALGNQGVGDELQTESGVRKALLGWFQAAGINPFQNPYAARLLARSGEVARLQPFYGLDNPDRAQFIRDWAQSQWTGGRGAYDTSSGGIRGRLDQTMDINGTPTNLFRSGDPDADANAFREISGLASRGYGDRIASTVDRLEAQKGLQYGGWLQANPNYSGQYADWRLGKGAQGTGFTPPNGAPGATPNSNTFVPPTPAPGLPPVNPNLTTFPSAPGNPWEAISAANSAVNPSAVNPNPPGASGSQAAALPYARPANGQPANPAYGSGATGGTRSTQVDAAPGGYPGFSPERGTVAGNPALVFKAFQDIAANAGRHITAPGQSSMLLPGGWQYNAPADVARRYWTAGSTGREPGGQAKGASGWNLLKDWIANLTRTNPNLTPEQAMAAAMQYLTNRAGGDPAKLARFGFSRVG